MRTKTLAFFVILSFAFAVAGFAADPAAQAPEKKYGQEEGDFLRPVTLKFAEGDKVLKTDELKRKSLFILVSSVCTSCRTELEDVSNNLKEFDGKADVYIIVIDMDPKPAVDRIKDKVAGIPLLADSEYALGRAVNLLSAPSTVLVGADGKILLKKSGYRGGEWKEYVKAVLK
jgi:peroxiredoxin